MNDFQIADPVVNAYVLFLNTSDIVSRYAPHSGFDSTYAARLLQARTAKWLGQGYFLLKACNSAGIFQAVFSVL